MQSSESPDTIVLIHGLWMTPRSWEHWVPYDDRAPLLFIAGGADHIMPPSVNRSNAEHYAKSTALTEYTEFPGRDHWTCGAPGWEQIADHALSWALAHARPSDLPEAQVATPT